MPLVREAIEMAANSCDRTETALVSQLYFCWRRWQRGRIGLRTALDFEFSDFRILIAVRLVFIFDYFIVIDL